MTDVMVCGSRTDRVHGKPQAVAEEFRARGSLALFVEALKASDQGAECHPEYGSNPNVWVRLADGRWLRPRFPVHGCRILDPAALLDLVETAELPLHLPITYDAPAQAILPTRP